MPLNALRQLVVYMVKVGLAEKWKERLQSSLPSSPHVYFRTRRPIEDRHRFFKFKIVHGGASGKAMAIHLSRPSSNPKTDLARLF